MNRTLGVVTAPVMAIVMLGLATACADPSSSSAGPVGAGESPEPSANHREIDGCPVTMAPQPGFVPPEPYPSEPASQEVWYGTQDLWTTLDSNGEVWSGLPVQRDGHIGDKTLWFSEKFSTAEGEDFSGNADITVTAVHLDGSAPEAVQKGGVPSFNRYIRNFMLVGIAVPERGCWEVTASYQGAELSYVMFVKD